MIHALRFANFFSFAEQAEVSFVQDGRLPEHDSCYRSVRTGEQISKLMAVVGANGAGKTNVIKALDFLCWFASASFAGSTGGPLSIFPHLMSGTQVSRFELDFEVADHLYRYTLHLTRERVVYECLAHKTSRLYSKLFTRSWDTVAELEQIKQAGFGMPSRQAERVKPLASLLSTAEQFGVEHAVRVVDALRRCHSNVDAWGRVAFSGARDVLGVADFYAKREVHRERMAQLLRQWDFGLTDVQIESHRTVGKDGQDQELLLPVGIHRDGEMEMRLPLVSESSGTQAAFVLLSRILPTLADGGIVLLDELEADLHPLMLEPILDLFISRKTNPHNAQLVFTSHALETLNLLKKGQILLVEKNERCRSEAWRLADMEGVRSDDNFYAKYMAGAYGAVPIL